MLKRIHYPNCRHEDLYIGATINIFSRNLQVAS